MDQFPNTNIEKSLVSKDKGKGKEAAIGADTSGTKDHRFLIEDLNLTPPIEIEDDESYEDVGPSSEVVVKQEQHAQHELVLRENCPRLKEQVAAKRKAPLESCTGESSSMEPMRNPSPVVLESSAPEARKHANLSEAAYGIQRQHYGSSAVHIQHLRGQHDGSSAAYSQHPRTSYPNALWPHPAVAQPFMLGHQPSGMGILGPTPSGFRLNMGTTPRPNYMPPHTLPGTSSGNRSGPTPSGFRLNMGTPPRPNYMPPRTLPGTSPNNRTGPTYGRGQVSSLNPPFLGAFRFRDINIENRATPSWAGPSGSAMETPRVDWSEEELDHLWIGVRRHGLGNWGAMLTDPHLKFSRSKTANDLDSRWSLQEAVKTIPMPPWALTERILRLSEPTSSGFPATGAIPESGGTRSSRGGL